MSQTVAHNTLIAALKRLDLLTNWESRPRSSMRPSLEPVRDLMQRLGNPHQHFRAVHVAGTKGKGSVCALIEAGMIRAGLRIGRYASPHLERVNERVSIMGQPVDDTTLANALVQALDCLEAAKQENTPAFDATWFDLLTAAAFLVFREAGLEWVAVEVGLGGRLDSSNIVHGEVAIVTNIELEHTEILGATREAIAGEKVGILKPHAVLITTLAATDEAGQVLQARAAALGAQVFRTEVKVDDSIETINTALAGLALDYLGTQDVLVRADMTSPRVGAWLLDTSTRAAARLPGRLERMEIPYFGPSPTPSRTIPVVLDGAHVPFNLEAVLRDLWREPDLGVPCVAVVAIAGDKDALGLLTALSRYVQRVVFTELPSAGIRHAALELHRIAQSVGLPSEVREDPRKALERGLQLASESQGWVLVTGSLHLVGSLRQMLRSDPH